MKQILLFGAGKSATVLIRYLLAQAQKENWELIVADANLQLALDKINNSKSGRAISFDICDDEKRKQVIAEADLVISMLPPTLHGKVAKDCLSLSRHLLTASYVDDEMRSMQEEIKNKNLIFLCEMGLDPGIDHMSAMKIIDTVHADGGNITSFKSHCGGLVAPESDDNPWHYKISWNPRNIALAGKAGAILKVNNKVVNLTYDALFENNESVDIPDVGGFAYYPNRDSLSYIPLYGLEETATFVRTTLRHPDFCKGWNYVIKAFLTDEEKDPFYTDSDSYSFRQWLDKTISIKTGLDGYTDFLQKSVSTEDKALVNKLFDFLGLGSDELIPASARCAVDVLQFALEKKLSLLPGDKDMIVMLHEFEYIIGKNSAAIRSSLVVKGDNNLDTAMAKTVGLPLGIAAKLILDGTITLRGLQIPVAKEIYDPVLNELEQHGIRFTEEKT